MTFMQCRLFLVSLYPQNRPIEYMYLAEPIEDVFHLKDEREREFEFKTSNQRFYISKIVCEFGW